MKSVCIIVYHLGVGGAEQTVVGETQEFLRRGFRVHLITLSPERKHSLMSFVPGECEREVIQFRSLYDWQSLRSLSRRLRETKPDIIITQMWFANTVGRVAARMAGLSEHVLAFEQNVYDRLRLKSWKQFLVDRFLQRWCRRVVAVSRAIKASLLRCGIHQERITVIYDSIDLSRCEKAPQSSIREELRIGQEFLYFFAGRLVHQKGVDILLKAFAQQTSGVLMVAGQGVERENLESLVRKLGIQSRVFFLGVRHDVPSLMKTADCFVLASRLEGLGIVLVEAIACGLPVIATKIDGIVEVVHDDKIGTLVPPDDVGGFARAMQEMRENTGQRELVGKEGRQHMQQLFSIQKHVDDVLACF